MFLHNCKPKKWPCTLIFQLQGLDSYQQLDDPPPCAVRCDLNKLPSWEDGIARLGSHHQSFGAGSALISPQKAS